MMIVLRASSAAIAATFIATTAAMPVIRARDGQRQAARSSARDVQVRQLIAAAPGSK